MNLFQVPPFDQHLHLGSRILSDTTKTLGELEVLPNSLIFMIADDPNTGGPGGGGGGAGGNGLNGVEEEEWNEEVHMEEGFKGELLK